MVCDRQRTELYATTCGSHDHPSQVTEVLTPPICNPVNSRIDGKRSMKVPAGIPFQIKLHSLVVIQFNDISVTSMKQTIIQSIEITVNQAFELGFQARNTEIESFFFCYL